MRLQILGGGNNQINAIKRAKEKGHEVVLIDYFEDAPGRKYAKYNEVVSTFDVEGNIAAAKKYSVDGIMTLGTDQPIYTAARVASELNLPSFLDVPTAKAVTNKKIMKDTFAKYNIPSVKYKFVDKDFKKRDCQGMKFPVVLKPLDSQGQRGVFKLNTPKEVENNILNTLSYSREEEALLEEFYESDEITVSSWVIDGKPYILTITDRGIFQRGKHIGICFAHDFPTKHIDKYEEIKKINDDITKAFKIQNGPLYVQLLVGRDGILVNEIACRIGGAYEDIFIPYLTGIDILDLVIDHSLGQGKISDIQSSPLESKSNLSVQLFFANAGKVKEITPIKTLLKLPGVISAGYNISKGMEIQTIKNATARAGYIIIVGAGREELYRNINNTFDNLKILNESNNNLAIQSKYYE
jgi:biotin carboxylase